MLVVALTGGVATGKSTVSRRLMELGAAVLDADQAAREVVEPGEPALEEIRAAFGPGVIASDGTLDRQALGEIVFNDKSRRSELEAIIHPRVRQRMDQALHRLKAEGRFQVVVCDIPLLYETGMSLARFDRVLVVYAPFEVQKRRLMNRNDLNEAQAEARIRAQLPTEEKARRADDVIDNTGELYETLRQVGEVWKEWLRLCASR